MANRHLAAVARRYSPAQLELLARNITLAEIERQTGIKAQQVSRVLLGRNWPHPPTIRALASVIGVTEARMFQLLLAAYDWNRKLDGEIAA